MELYPHQVDGRRDINAAWDSGKRRVLYVAPTGSGKTALMSATIQSDRTIWLAHRTELIDQALRTLRSFGIEAGCIKAGRDEHPERRVQVASVGTLLARDSLPEFDLMLADEAHHFATASERWSTLLAKHHGRILGATATPERTDGAGLGDMFDHLIVGPSVRDLTTAGRLVPCRIIRPDRALASGELAQHPVDAYGAHAGQRGGSIRQGIVFCRNVEDAISTALAFNMAGIKADAIVGETEDEKRARSIDAFRAGDIRVLTNVMVLTEGTDLPMAEICMFASGVGSIGVYIQKTGRVLRTYAWGDGSLKTEALLIDLPGCSWFHGCPEDERVFKLHGRGIARTDVIYCPVCAAIRVDGAGCTECGWMPETKEQKAQRILAVNLVKYQRLIRQSDAQRLETVERKVHAMMLKGWRPSAIFAWHNAVFQKPLDKEDFNKIMKAIPGQVWAGWKKAKALKAK